MQLAGRLYSAWSLVRERLKHRDLLIFLLLHIITSAILFILSILSVESNAEASHFLRHITQTANLSAVVFYNPDNGKFGDWKTAPALVLTSNETISKQKEDGIMCNDDGKKCKAVGKGLHRHEDEIEPTFVQQFQQTTDTSTMTMTTQGQTITTRVLVVPTLTVIAAEAITTEVLLNEQGSLMESATLATATTRSSTATRSASIMSSLIASTSTATASSSVAAVTSTLTSANPTTSSKALIEEEEEEDEEEEESDDDSDHSSNSSDSEDEVEEEAKPKVLRVSKNEYISAWKRDIQLSAAQDSGTVVGVNIAHLSGSNGPSVVVTQVSCHSHDQKRNREVLMVTFSISNVLSTMAGQSTRGLDNLVREETVLAAFFIWILGLAIVGLLNESIPHLLALLLSLIISMAWTTNGLRLSFKFWSTFESTTSTHCDGINVLPSYWEKRVGFQSAVLGSTVVTLIASGLLCWKIRDHFGWQTFQRIGASSKINKIYKLVLALSILLQLDAFVLVAFFALFLDQALLPWLYFGWTWIRQEQRKRFNIFVGLSVLIIGGWAVTFANQIFRIVFTTWAFFTCMGSLAVGLTAITVVLAIIRRLTFGQGLADFLYLEEVHERPNSGLLDEKPSMPVAMPRSNLPTFSTAFGPGPAPPPRQMFPPMPVYTTATRVASWNTGDDRRAL
ncbi:hypothetical protein L486_01069 [Kwoniella mangroviensis CBS 10435]|uniref:Uncharacterized protein n=1 Tax=Kwoniella mangroviensis CBS 10435 TaxID=1331196 RepID=A0A1B9J0V5_9TREE|nr:hypothetical protein L486_01069 [Kwoniella mangroviensis CBS 10435]